jgi:hypothetical protein
MNVGTLGALADGMEAHRADKIVHPGEFAIGAHLKSDPGRYARHGKTLGKSPVLFNHIHVKAPVRISAEWRYKLKKALTGLTTNDRKVALNASM